MQSDLFLFEKNKRLILVNKFSYNLFKIFFETDEVLMSKIKFLFTIKKVNKKQKLKFTKNTVEFGFELQY